MTAGCMLYVTTCYAAMSLREKNNKNKDKNNGVKYIPGGVDLSSQRWRLPVVQGSDQNNNSSDNNIGNDCTSIQENNTWRR